MHNGRQNLDPGAILASTVTAAAALGFVPVAIHFNFLQLLNQIGPRATAEALTQAVDRERSEEDRQTSPLCLQLTQDTMFAMAGLGFVDLIEEDIYQVNAVTEHMMEVPSSIHGMLHFTTEPLFAAAFLMRQLKSTHFQYPFHERGTPIQYGYRMMGASYADEHTYSIMHHQGRMPSFNIFMEGKFGKFGKMPERVKGFGYDLDSVIEAAQNEVVMVDVGGGRGEMLLEVLEEYPHLKPCDLVLQDYQPEVVTDKLTVKHWDFKDGSPQPVRGAHIYSLTHIYHNLPDQDALDLMKKIAEAMKLDSRMLIHEFAKNSTYGKMHATMIELYAGRLRSSREWEKMAALAGLHVTFEHYAPVGESLVEMIKIRD